MKAEIPLRTIPGMNAREHWRARANRVGREKFAVGTLLATKKHERPQLPVDVTLTRVAPSNGLDGDNLQGALKAVRDSVADWYGIDDRNPLIEWKYAQRRGEWAVMIEVE